MLYSLDATGVGEERDLWGGASFLADLLEDTADGEDVLIVGNGVGHITNDDIHARVGEHLSVSANHKVVRKAIVSQMRLAPPVEGAFRAILWVVGMGGQKLGIVVEMAGVMDLRHPEKIEDTYYLAGAWWAALGGAWQCAPQAVGRDPGVAL